MHILSIGEVYGLHDLCCYHSQFGELPFAKEVGVKVDRLQRLISIILSDRVDIEEQFTRYNANVCFHSCPCRGADENPRHVDGGRFICV